MSARPSSTQRDRDRRYIARGKPPCHLCGDEIDYTVKSPDPMSYELDHVVPLNKGGTWDRDNLAPSHRHCNRAKSDTSPTEGDVVFVTDRTW